MLIDGRTAHTPLYASVFWVAQNLPPGAVDRFVDALPDPPVPSYAAEFNTDSPTAREVRRGTYGRIAWR